MEIILFIFIYIGFPIFVCLFVAWKSNSPQDKDSLTISFNQFIAFYQMAPYNWELQYNYVMYHHNYYKVIEFTTAIDCIKYKRWHKKKIKRETEIQRSKEMAQLIAEWQKDINNAQKANVQNTKDLMKKNEEDAKKYGGI